jgi:hypothetical protein
MQPITVPDFCKQALTRILVNNDTPSPKISPVQLNQAIAEYNLIADSWGADGKMVYSQQFYTFALVPGQQTYTIGANTTINGNTVTADFDTTPQPRPSYLEFASFEQVTSNPYADLPMKIIDAAEWASIVTKNIATNIGFYIYMDGQYPQANLNIWPLPSQSANIVLTTWTSLNSNVGQGDVIALPPGYARGLSLDLSLAMAPYYGKSGDPSIQQIAGVLSKIKRDIGFTNIRSGRLQYSSDAQGASTRGGVYDAQSDQVL